MSYKGHNRWRQGHAEHTIAYQYQVVTSFLWIVSAIILTILTLVKVPTPLKDVLETLLREEIEFETLSFAAVAFMLRICIKLISIALKSLVSLYRLLASLLDLISENWNKPKSWISGIKTLFKRKYHLVEMAGIFFSIGNLFYVCLFLRPELILIALMRCVWDLSFEPLDNLITNDLNLFSVLSFVLGLSGVSLFFYHTYFIDIFYGRFHDPVVKKINLEVALPNRGYEALGASEFYCFEQEVRLARSGHITFGGPKAAMFSFAMAVLSKRLEGNVRSMLLPAAFFEYLTNHSPALRDIGYAVRSVLDPVLNPVGFSNLLALIAACLVMASEAISMFTLTGDAAQVHQAAFVAGFLIVVKKVGWIIATVHGRVSLVFKARKMRSLFVQELPIPPWRRVMVGYVHSVAKTWPWLETISQRLGRDVWKSMGNLYALLGWFSLIFIEGEFLVSAWEQVEAPIKEQTAGSLLGSGVAPLMGIILFTLLHNPEAMYRIGMAIFNLPAFWLYTKLADHDTDLPMDEVAEGEATISSLNWLLQPEWQWFWDELLEGCEGNDQKYRRLKAVISDAEWIEQICQYLNIQSSEQWQISLVPFAFRPIQPMGWLSFLRSPEKRQRTEKAQQVISGYLEQLNMIESVAKTEAT